MKVRIPEVEVMIDPLEVEAFNLWCRRYLSKLGYQEVYKSLCRYDVSEGKLIELGTGSGWLAIELLHLNKRYQIIGVDLSAEMLALARKNAATFHLESSSLNFVAADVGKLPFPDNAFDAAVSYASLHHWSGNLPAIFKEIRRVVKNEGFITIHDLKREPKSLTFLKAIPSTIVRKSFESSVRAAYTPAEMSTLLKASQITEDWQVIENTLGFGIEGRVIK